MEGIAFQGVLELLNVRKTSFCTAKLLKYSACFFNFKELFFFLFELQSFPFMKRIALVCHV